MIASSTQRSGLATPARNTDAIARVRCSRFGGRIIQTSSEQRPQLPVVPEAEYPKKCFDEIPSSFDTVPTQAPSGSCPVMRLTNSECGKLMFGVKWITSPPFTMISMVSPSRILILSFMQWQKPNSPVQAKPPEQKSGDNRDVRVS